MFPQFSPKQSFPEIEAEILAFWKEHKIFEKSVESRSPDNPYRFFDGPPFVTGMPHYGSLLSSICKDVVGRYWTMQGKRVERVWGWDGHGIPIEEKVQKKLGLESSRDIESIGVEKFIQECYNYTKQTSEEWEWYIDHIGRWVDFKNSYKTWDQNYMESVLWVFKQLWDKGCIYQGKRVSLYSTKLSTPISNFEVAMDNSYAEVNDPAITVKFPAKLHEAAIAHIFDDSGRVLLGWSNKFQAWHFPGGAVESGESIEQGLEREVLEELGARCISMKRIHQEIQCFRGKAWRATHFAVVLDPQTPITLCEPEKFREWKFFDREELGDLSSVAPIDREAVSIAFGELPQQLESKSLSFLAWTTTPWTIPAHMALAIHKNITYVQVRLGDEDYIIAKNRFDSVFKGHKDASILFEIADNSDILGVAYHAPFPEFYQDKIDPKSGFQVYDADFITDEDGTGIGHEAPEFGDVDFELGKKYSIHLSQAMDAEGKYTSEISLYQGMFYRDANAIVMEELTKRGVLFRKESITHRVAMCPRTGLPLVYKTQDSWFIRISDKKEELLRQNEDIYWFPEHLKHGRFAKSIEGAPDWCISRTRYWGAPMPVWMGRDEQGEVQDIKVFDSRASIEAASGMKVTDLHKPYIDSIQWTENGLHYTRVPEVLDVWLDSGAMPYAQLHYPFENKEKFEKSFPADFIVEYIGQIRAWFYVMHTLGVLLTGKPAFKNVITTGVVFGTDGRKMSKSFKNYPDPKDTILKYGADALRMYQMNSPLVSGGDASFNETGIEESLKRSLLPFWNTASFLSTYANIDNWKPEGTVLHYVRHGETDLNTSKSVSGGGIDISLNEKGRQQIAALAQEIAFRGEKYDVIVSSNLLRAQETAQIIAQTLDYPQDAIVIEPLFGERRVADHMNGRSWAEVRKEYAEKHGVDPETLGLHHLGLFGDAESSEDLYKRSVEAYQNLLKKYPGKRILVVAHGNIFRALHSYCYGKDLATNLVDKQSRIANGQRVELPTVPRSHPLDIWMISKLQTFLAAYTGHFERYDLQSACREILTFTDDLTNWYVRLSRRRFWKSESDSDKNEAYETLYDVVVKLSQVLAPIAPFLSEYVYKGFTQEQSVHLSHFPQFQITAIDKQVMAQMDRAKNIVSLGLTLRSRLGLRVRQPLASLTLSEALDPYYEAIVLEELNVKEILVRSGSDFARKICRPNARILGPIFGKGVQEIITRAKSGDFQELDSGEVQVGDSLLPFGSFEIVYEPMSGMTDVEGGYGMVIALDTQITPELYLEGVARDVIRSIQELRKNSGFHVSDRIYLSLSGEKSQELLSSFESMICGETLAEIQTEGNTAFTTEIEIPEGKILIGIDKK